MTNLLPGMAMTVMISFAPIVSLVVVSWILTPQRTKVQIVNLGSKQAAATFPKVSIEVIVKFDSSQLTDISSYTGVG